MSPPNEERVAQALDTVTPLSPAALDQRIANDLGSSLIAAFALLAARLRPDDPPADRARSVHLMVTAALLTLEARREP